MDQKGIFDHAWHSLLLKVWIFEWIPFVDFVLVSGSLATGDAHRRSDWDVIVGTRPRRLYMARFFCLGILKLLGMRTDIANRGGGFCLNHFIATDGVLEAPRDAYAEAMHRSLVPVVGTAEYITTFLVASGAMREGVFADARYRYRKPKIPLVACAEILFDLVFGGWAEALTRRVQERRIAEQAVRFEASAQSRIIVTDSRVELCFHPKKEPGKVARGIDHGEKADMLLDTMMNIKPIADRVFLEAVEEDRMTKSGIVLPDTAEKERPVKGRVLAVGAGKRNDRGELNPMSVKVGDLVLFKKYGPDEVEFDGKKYLVADEADILAILES